jgi:hypothetical protein
MAYYAHGASEVMAFRKVKNLVDRLPHLSQITSLTEKRC